MTQTEIHTGLVADRILLQFAGSVSWLALTRLQTRKLAADLVRLANDQQLSEFAIVTTKGKPVEVNGHVGRQLGSMPEMRKEGSRQD